MKFLCAICTRRSADTMHHIDGKHRPVCMPCIDEPVPDPDFKFLRKLHGNMRGSPAQLLLDAVRSHPGSTFIELREALNIAGDPGCNGPRSDEARKANTYSVALKRLAASGQVLREGRWPNFTYRIADEQRRAA